MPPTESREEKILRALKRCDPDTIAAALRYQTTRGDADLPVIIRGVLSRDLPADCVGALEAATDDSALFEELGMDSFGMIELVMTAEEVFGITIGNEEMKNIATLGQLKAFLQMKIRGAESASPREMAPQP